MIYYTGRRGKEGLRDLNKDSFDLKVGPDGKEYIQINFNEKTKRNQGDSNSAAVNALHNDKHIISAIEGELCPVRSYKSYVSRLNPKQIAFFQKPSQNKKFYTAQCVGKNPLGAMMTEISKNAKLSRIYTKHQIRKTTATALHRSGFSLQEIANVTKHKNLDSLKHYVAGPSHSDKENYNEALHSYGSTTPGAIAPKRSNDDILNKKAPKIPKEGDMATLQDVSSEGNILKENCIVPMYPDDDSNTSIAVAEVPQNRAQNVVNNQLRQASNMFQNANFQNCNFTFTLPQ